MFSRRVLLKRFSTISLLGLFGSSIGLLQACKNAPAATGQLKLIKELDIRPFIIAVGTYTSMTASLMPDELMETIDVSSNKNVMLDEVQEKVGEKIAELCHTVAAMVSAGCWSAMVLCMAGVLTGRDSKKAAQLPDLESTDMKSEVFVQESHNEGYVHAITNTGITIVLVETRQGLENAARQVEGVTTEVTVPPIANHTPSLERSWDQSLVRISQRELREKLHNGVPSIELRGSFDNAISLTVFMLDPDQEKIVADRIQEELGLA